MQFKTEIALLIMSIVLFSLSAFCFSAAGVDFSYPLRLLAIPFIGSGGALMTVASISFNKRSKEEN